MTERPEDMATLYSQAHLAGTRYLDFSASRQEVRGQFRLRIVPGPAAQSEAPQPSVLPPRQPAEEVQAHQPQTPELPPPREGPAARWYALHSVFNPAEVAEEDSLAELMSLEERPPLLVVFSLAGGVGKTCLVATLGRALSALGEHVLLADTAACGLLPFYFGSREFRPGVVRTFSPPGSRSGAEADAPVQLLNLQPERYARADPRIGGEHDPFLAELLRGGRGASRIVVDVATASREVTNRLLQLRPTVLVPILPDLSSLACLGLLDILLADPPSQVLYLLNQFDDSLALHLDVRAMLQQQLGDRLIPLVLRHSSVVSEAVADGMTVIDYAPGSGSAEDYRALAGWMHSFLAPAVARQAGTRWSER
ncbi:MAG: cellulose synthase operon protein YhjQ/BcsQ [Acidobacteriaceae bacterium]|jgi:cellulose synthase operon protein YhjQ